MKNNLKQLKNIFFASIGFMLCICEAEAQQKFVSVKGREIIDRNGKPLKLRGVNLGFWLEPESYPLGWSNKVAGRHYFDLIADIVGPDDARKFWSDFQENFITKEDIFYSKKLGLNHVRVPFDYRLFVNEYFLGSYEPVKFKYLDRVMEWCREAGMYVVLDMHCAPGGQAGWNSDNGNLYPWLFEENGEESRKLTIKIWKDIASRYANDTILIGYDLLNEPIHQYCDTARLNKTLEPFYKRLVAEIRTVDPNHIMFVGGAFWNRNFNVFTKPFDSKSVYTTHLYHTNHDYSAPEYFAAFSKKHNVPIWVGEFGELDVLKVDTVVRGIEKQGFGWSLWSIKKMNNNHTFLHIKKPENWDLITNYVNGCYKNWEEKVKARPDYTLCKKALDEFIENMKFKNCTQSDYYFKTLGIVKK